MIFKKYFSSSYGNLYSVTAANGQRLLIECGVPWKRLEKAIKYDLKGIEGCLISHEHKDHSKAVEDVLKAGIPIFASEGTLKTIDESLPLSRNVRVIRALDRFSVSDGFEIFPFSLHHDAAEPLGFIVYDSTVNEYLFFATDTSHITQRFGLAFDIIAIECSYDREIVQDKVDKNEIDLTLGKRLLNSHQEWRDAKKYLKDYYIDKTTGEKYKICDLSKCREIQLLHPSGENLDKKAVRKDIEDAVFVKTFI